MLFLILFKLLFSISTAITMGCGILLLFIPIKNNFTFLEKLAYSYGIGLGVITIIMLFLSLFKIPLNFKLIFPVIFIIIVFIVTIKKVDFKKTVEFLKSSDKSVNNYKPTSCLEFIFIFFLSYLILSSLFNAIFVPMQDWDAMAKWGLKSKIFYINQGITFLDFDILNEYPNLIPLAETWVYINLGTINDRLVMILFPLFFIFLIILFFSFQRRSGFSKIHSLIFTVFLVTGSNALIEQSSMGYADLALTFFYSFGTLLFYSWIKNSDKPEYFILSAIYMGICTWTKSEGFYMVLIIFALLITYTLQNKSKNNIKKVFIFLCISGMFFIPWQFFCNINKINITARYEFQLPNLKMITNVLYCINEFLLRDLIWIFFFFLCIFTWEKTLSFKKLGYLSFAVFLNLFFIITIHLINSENNLQTVHNMDRLILHITPLTVFLISSQVNEIIKTFGYNDLEDIVLIQKKRVI